ncbi:MAG: phenylalanine--tRNA ligase subunit beta, partial [Anaerolineaceae bacterium]|nr:phenylalanine--tRNA ligase subunit beta [Anaerolineaceae bacterium]
VKEDIAVIVDESLSAVDVENKIWEAGGKILTGVTLFDIFRSQQIGTDKKSLAYRLTYQSYEKTLTDEEATTIRSRIVRRLEKDLGAKLRG